MIEYDDEAGEEQVLGDFSRTFAGRRIRFYNAKPGQFNALQRYRMSLKARIDKLKAFKGEPTREMLDEAVDISNKHDLAILALIESLLVDKDGDGDFLQMAMITGTVEMSDLMGVLFADDDPEDDTEPAPRKKSTPRKAAAKKATANVKRTRR